MPNSGLIVEKFANDIGNIASSIKPVLADVYAIYPSDNNLFVIPHAPSGISALRKKATEIFESNGIIPKLPKNLDTMWISTVRIRKPFSEEEIDTVVNKLPKKVFKDVLFNELYVALSDQSFSKGNSTLLFKHKLDG